MTDLGIVCWVIVAVGMVWTGIRQVALWWRVQDLERVVRELIKEVDGDSD